MSKYTTYIAIIVIFFSSCKEKIVQKTYTPKGSFDVGYVNNLNYTNDYFGFDMPIPDTIMSSILKRAFTTNESSTRDEGYYVYGDTMMYKKSMGLIPSDKSALNVQGDNFRSLLYVILKGNSLLSVSSIYLPGLPIATKTLQGVLQNNATYTAQSKDGKSEQIKNVELAGRTFVEQEIALNGIGTSKDMYAKYGEKYLLNFTVLYNNAVDSTMFFNILNGIKWKDSPVSEK
jgi:hypothetical protein